MLVERAYALVNRALFGNAPRTYRHLYSAYKRWTEPGEFHLFRSILRPGMLAVDVGSNIGIFTELFARLVGPDGLVHSFEPDPDNYARQRSACSRFTNIRFNCAAVGPRSGRLSLYRSPDLNVDHRTFDSGGNRATLEVPAVALDDYFPPGSSVDLVKMDIQGFELQALAGMTRLLSESHHVSLVLEYFPEGLEAANGSGAALSGMLRQLGFDLYSFSRSGRLHELRDVEPAVGSSGYTNVMACRSRPYGT